ncbi:uncharacterized protein E6C27_scaffold437G00350 [Cucumis melo var. makuwa]|uniref:Uncharacterized protein n=1 Tax=Cucumis melo var. makuwa TaxID=1194695 RepID=A0A5A7UJI4_CUCMM|nr:uncharacterized protein E6C27_scaffold437G00350 [Cucumis melo var. makuwa]
MRWHKDKRVDTKDVLRRPVDAAGWKHFDKEFPQFASEPRNVCLGLASDSFNPFGNMSTAYSMCRQHDGKFEHKSPPVVMNRDEILQQVNSINFSVLRIETRFNKNPRNDDSMNRQLGCGDFEVFKQNVRPMGGSVVRTLSEDEKSMCHCGCFENGLRFHSIERDNRRTTQKSGIMAYRETKAEEMNYYGVLQEALDLEYPKCRRCNGSQLGTKKRGRGVRGYGRNIELDKFVEKHGKIKTEINEEEGKPITTFAPKIVLSIGTAVRNTIPLSCENWKAVPMGVRKLVIDRLEKKKKGCDVDEIEVFHETHFRDKEGWINDGKRCIQSTEAGVQTISSAKACEFVLGSRSMQTVNPRSGESLRSNVSSTREKEKNEMAYLKEANEKLTHELAKWEQSYGSQSCI